MIKISIRMPERPRPSGLEGRRAQRRMLSMTRLNFENVNHAGAGTSTVEFEIQDRAITCTSII